LKHKKRKKYLQGNLAGLMKEINRLKLFTTRKKKVVNFKRKIIEKWNTMSGSDRRNRKRNQ
jgi:hypothetical protein